MPNSAPELTTLSRPDWGREGPAFWRGRFDGDALKTGVSVIFFTSDTEGDGPPLHTHPYDEVFIIREGRAEITVGDYAVIASAGDVVCAPADTPHTFKNLGPGRLETTDIHISPRIIQTDLE